MAGQTCPVRGYGKEATGYIDILTNQHQVKRIYYCNHHLKVIRNYTAKLSEEISKHQQPTENTMNLTGVPEDVVAHALMSEGLV